MNNRKTLLLIVAAISIGLLGFALYLQHQMNWAPCPLCIIQRYAFVAIALICLIFAFLPASSNRVGSGLSALAALTGVGVAGWHNWVKTHPTISCGIDPLETSLNRIPPADWFPFMFKADGLCGTPYPPILGLEIQHWSLLWFVILAVMLAWNATRRS